MDMQTLGETYSPAVRSGDVETVRELLDRYPELVGTPDSLNWYLHAAAGSNQVAVMALLVERGADINAPYTALDPTGPVHDAAGEGAADAVRWLLERGAALTYQDRGRTRCSGLVQAALGGHLECVRLLVEAGAPLELAGESAMAAARMGDHEDVIDYLRSVGVPADEEDEDDQGDEADREDTDMDMDIDAIHERYYPAVVAGDLEAVRDLLDEYADSIGTQRELDRYLHIAAKHNRVGVMELLVGRGADVNAPYSEAEPDGPITRAAMYGASDAIRWLLRHGASVTIPGQEDDPCPGLTLAAMDGHLECVRLLVEAGAPLETSGALALFAAKNRSQPAVAEYLRSVGAPESQADPGDGGPDPDDDDLPDGYTLEEEDDEEGEGETETLGGPLPDLRRHLEQNVLGMIEPDLFQEILPSDPPIRVLVLDQFGVRKVIVTEGMSARPVPGPVPYAELMMVLPPDWPLGEAVADDRHGWPVSWLRRLAHLPHETGRGYPPVIRFDNEEPLGPGIRFSALLLLAGFGENGSYTRSDGEQVQLYTVLPLYPEENALAESEGLRRLMALFDERQVSIAMTPGRASVVDPS